MRKFVIAFAMLVGAVTPALASRHPATPEYSAGFVDAAAVPTYPTEAVHAVKRHHHPRRAETRQRPRQARRAPSHGRPKVEASRPIPVQTLPSPVQAAVHAAVAVGAEARALGDMLGIPDGYEDGFTAPVPVIVGVRPSVISGVLQIAGSAFKFVSGGAGWSIPYGDYDISPDSQGRWGSHHGALDLTGTERGTIPDRQLGRNREGVEIHANFDGRTEGCVGVDGWAKAKEMILAMIGRSGRAVLHVWPGSFTVTPQPKLGREIVYLPLPEREHEAVRTRTASAAERHGRRHWRRRLARL